METGNYSVVMQRTGTCMLYGPRVGIGNDCVVSLCRYSDLKDRLVQHGVSLPELAANQKYEFSVKSLELEFIA